MGLGKGMNVPDVCRRMGISQQTYYRWRTKYGGMDPKMAKQLQELQKGNSRLKKLVADQAPIPTPHGTAYEKLTLQLVFSPRNFSSCKDATRDLENTLGVVGRDSLAGESLHSPQGSPMVSRFRGCHFVAV